MKRTYMLALIIGLFVTACSDADIVEQNGTTTEPSTDGRWRWPFPF